ncbi:MAG: hypothetical protein Q9162_000645 [Coniocarpon cinnabarinum]
MTSPPGAKQLNDGVANDITNDADVDDSFATAPDVWRQDADDSPHLDEPRKIAGASDDSSVNEEDEGGDIDNVEDLYNEADSLQENPEDDTLPSLDQELQAEREASDSSIFNGPSPQGSSPRSFTPQSSRPSSALSFRRRSGAVQPFERRAQARNSSISSLASIRPASPAFLTAHSRQSSTSSQITSASADGDTEDQKPWEVIRWSKLRKVSSQLFSEAARRAFGAPTYLAVGVSIVVGTSKGLLILFDFQQNLKNIIGQGTPAAECGAVTALAISGDHTTVAAGHASGFIFTWDLSSSAKPFLTIPPLPRKHLRERAGDGHVSDQAVLHVGFLGTRHTALVSADDSGMAFSHLATRGMGAVGRTVKTTRLLGRYPEPGHLQPLNLKPSTVLAFAPLPLGNIVQPTDDIGLTAILTPYLMVIVSTTPVAQTQFKCARTKQTAAHGAMTGCLAWFPAVKLKSSKDGKALRVAKTKLVYCWSNVLSVMEVECEEVSSNEEDKRPPLHFHVRRHWKSEEAIVAVQWISRSVIALLTITQRLVILEDQTMHVTDTSDLNPRHIYHRDLFSRRLEPLVSKADQEDATMHGVVPDAYTMSFKAYKSRLFLLDSSDVSMGTLSNWADRLVAMMEAGRLIEAIELATVYYNGTADKVTVGLPDEDSARHPMVRERLLPMISAALRYTFKMDESDELGKDLRSALQELVEPMFTACIEMDEVDFLFQEVYEWYADASCHDAFFHALEPRIVQQQVTSVPTEALKNMMNWYASLGLAQRLQEMLVSLNTATLDIDQVTTMCKQLNLWDAFIYVWNEAVEDYVTPLAELISVAEDLSESDVEDHEQSNERQSAMKMFPYMAYIMTGRVYPEGSEMNTADAQTAQAAIYRYLFASTGYAPLRSILSFSPSEFMTVLNEAFEDPFLNDKTTEDSSEDEDDALQRTTFSINRQRIVHTLLDVLAPGSYDISDRIYLDIFIARNLPKYPQYILLPGRTLQNILTELCTPPKAELGSECELSVEYLLSVFRPSDTQNLIALFEKARFHRVLKATYKADRNFSKWLQTYFDDPEDPEAVFTTIRDCFSVFLGLSQRQLRDVKAIIVEHSNQLAELDVTATALTLQSSAPDLLQSVYEKLDDADQARYLLLQALLEREQAGNSLAQTVLDFLNQHRTAYIELMCVFDPAQVANYLTTIGSSSLELDSVLPVMERTGVIDAAVVLMANEGLQRQALDRLIQHLRSLQTALVGTFNAQHSKSLGNLVAEADKYTKMGIWLCHGSISNKAIKGQKQHNSSTATKLKRSDLSDTTLSPTETLWLDLANAMTDLSRAFTATLANSSETEDQHLKDVDDHLRRDVHDTFTALLAATTSSAHSSTSAPQARQSPDPQIRLLPILGRFLAHLSSSSSTLSNTNARASTANPSTSTLLPILTSIFEAHTFSHSLLSLSYKLISKDVFAQYADVVQARQRGWRPVGRACARCGERTWGVGAGARVWDEWATRGKRQEERVADHQRPNAFGGERRTKGKGREVVAKREESQEGEKMGLISFACGHLFHSACLDEGMKNRGLSVESDERGRRKWRCLVCH